MSRAASSAMPLCSKRAQIRDGARDDEGKLLRFRAAGVVDDASVGDGERSAKALAREIADHAGEVFLQDRSSAGRCCRSAAMPPSGLMLPSMSTAEGLRPWLCTSAVKWSHDVPRVRADVEVDGHAGIEIDAIEDALERFRRAAEAVAVGVRASRRKPASARLRRFAARAAPRRWRRPDRDDRRAPAPPRDRGAPRSGGHPPHAHTSGSIGMPS